MYDEVAAYIGTTGNVFAACNRTGGNSNPDMLLYSGILQRPVASIFVTRPQTGVRSKELEDIVPVRGSQTGVSVGRRLSLQFTVARGSAVWLFVMGGRLFIAHASNPCQGTGYRRFHITSYACALLAFLLLRPFVFPIWRVILSKLVVKAMDLVERLTLAHLGSSTAEFYLDKLFLDSRTGKNCGGS